MAGNCVRTAAELQPCRERRGAAKDRPIGADPQDLALGTLSCHAKGSKIGELPGDQPGVRPERSVQPPAEPVGARGAKPAVAVEDQPWHIPNLRLHPLNLPAATHLSRPRRNLGARRLPSLCTGCDLGRPSGNCADSTGHIPCLRFTVGCRLVDFAAWRAAGQDWNIDSRPWAGGSSKKTLPPYATGHGSRK